MAAVFPLITLISLSTDLFPRNGRMSTCNHIFIYSYNLLTFPSYIKLKPCTSYFEHHSIEKNNKNSTRSLRIIWISQGAEFHFQSSSCEKLALVESRPSITMYLSGWNQPYLGNWDCFQIWGVKFINISMFGEVNESGGWAVSESSSSSYLHWHHYTRAMKNRIWEMEIFSNEMAKRIFDLHSKGVVVAIKPNFWCAPRSVSFWELELFFGCWNRQLVGSIGGTVFLRLSWTVHCQCEVLCNCLR